MNLMYFIFFNLVIYLPFHLFEEAVGDFPKWMYEHKWLPYHMTHEGVINFVSLNIMS